jgi:hypothetical protein
MLRPGLDVFLIGLQTTGRQVAKVACTGVGPGLLLG